MTISPRKNMQLPGPSLLDIQLGTCYSIDFKIKAPLQALETQEILPLAKVFKTSNS